MEGKTGLRGKETWDLEGGKHGIGREELDGTGWSKGWDLTGGMNVMGYRNVTQGRYGMGQRDVRGEGRLDGERVRMEWNMIGWRIGWREGWDGMRWREAWDLMGRMGGME